MTETTHNTILIIGGPNAGKTHFGAQLYGRLSARTSAYKILSPPEDITIFKTVLDNLSDGKSSGHTAVNTHKTLRLEVENLQGDSFTFSFPDYGGEQVNAIVADRRINETWKTQIDQSNAWLLFIRLDELLPVEDVVSRDLPPLEVLESRQQNTEVMSLSAAAFYTELLQILLYAKKVATRERTAVPWLTVVISCWDLLPVGEQQLLPKDVLFKRLPFLLSFIDSNWKATAYNIIGLSSIERPLSDKDGDPEFIRKGPENFGYIISQEGRKDTDLTLAISSFFGA